eukprot:m.306054 g.306054  ORF g.306054 m.306054 type:complete len:206 (+) comp55304_c0_seq2:4536-5153(+)
MVLLMLNLRVSATEVLGPGGESFASLCSEFFFSTIERAERRDSSARTFWEVSSSSSVSSVEPRLEMESRALLIPEARFNMPGLGLVAATVATVGSSGMEGSSEEGRGSFSRPLCLASMPGRGPTELLELERRRAPSEGRGAAGDSSEELRWYPLPVCTSVLMLLSLTGCAWGCASDEANQWNWNQRKSGLHLSLHSLPFYERACT